MGFRLKSERSDEGCAEIAVGALAIAEDMADNAAFDRVVARLASGEEEAVPAAFANRIIDGESPLRVYRGLTQVALAEASGVNRVQIADIEAGRKSGSVETVRKLAAALNVAVDDLV